ncbi:ZIP family metal transporter [Flavobacterium sediminilitoris]|uniref:ZIP family metal transporter n=1 Tax=Flavobacterium sediminilitoris TaxID=2024526 RepID=A0ABY4HM62_9FLAO|nr:MULTISPECIES: ZIP family metal transporter [Flavobacterium]UOX33775.1 ZIP family metal transporter [Flavobacterium sediminilitoris]
MDYSIYFLPLFAVLIGYFIALFLRPKSKKNLKLLLAFSGAFLLSLTVMHLLPEVYEADLHHSDGHHHHHSSPIGIFIMIGIVFQIVLEYFSKGAEHGHVHGHDKMQAIPWLLFFSLCLHALLEGMPISNHNHLAYGIAIHHFPIAIILTTFFVNAQLSKKAIFFFMMIFALMTPLGTFISENLHFLSKYYTQISGIVIGILFHISSTIIFESSEGHKFNLAKLSVIVLGIILAYFM